MSSDVGIPARLIDRAGTVVFDGTLEVEPVHAVGLPFSIGDALVVGDIGQVTIEPSNAGATPLDVFSAANHVFTVGTDGNLHGQTGKTLSFDL